MKTTTRVPASNCLRCGEVNTSATPADDKTAPPRPGDWSVCLYCGHLAAFADDLTLRPLTAAEMDEIADYPEIGSVLSAREQARKEIEGQAFDGEPGTYGDWQCSACKPDPWR